jgi:hypothetical protein
MNPEEAVPGSVQRMPADATLEESTEELYVRRCIAERERELEAGRGIPHDDVKRRLAKWLA